MEAEDRKPHEKLLEAYDNAYSEVREKLLLPHNDLGLVLKCHLIAEHSLNSYLIEAKGLPNLPKAKLSFSQKVELLDEEDGMIFHCKGSLKQLNKIRNDFGHNFQATLEIREDSAIAREAEKSVKSAEQADARLIAKYEKLGGKKESVELLKTFIDEMRAELPDEGNFLGDNHALLSQQEPRELIANFVTSFCEKAALEIFRYKDILKSS